MRLHVNKNIFDHIFVYMFFQCMVKLFISKFQDVTEMGKEFIMVLDLVLWAHQV